MTTAKITDLSGAATPLTGAELLELSQLSGGTYGSVQAAARYIAYAERQIGVFHDNSNQTGSTTAATAVTFGTTDIGSLGVTLVSGSRATISSAGIYEISVNLQIATTDTANHNVNIWLAKNGVAIPNTNSIANVPKAADGGTQHFLQTDIVTLAANDYIQVMWLPDSTLATLSAPAAGAIAPATPSAILMLRRISL